MAKRLTESLTIRLDKKTKAKLGLVYAETGEDESKLARRCIKCFVNNPDCEAIKKLKGDKI